MTMRTSCDSGSLYRSDTTTYTSGDHSSMSSTHSTLDAVGSITANAWDLMVRIPLQAAAAGVQWMTSGMQRIGHNGGSTTRLEHTGGSGRHFSGQMSSGVGAGHNSWSDWANPANWVSGAAFAGQDLTGSDLKYVVWSIVFTKPGYEAVIEPMQSELINYSTDVSSFAALKIAKCLERGRFGKLDKPASWVEHSYPADPAAAAHRTESRPGGGKTDGSPSEKGWRIPGEDQKYVQFLFRVEWRLPKEQPEVHVERVTVERIAS